MAESFVGEILLVPYNFAPQGTAFCQGQLLPISQNTALFSLLGTTYGGDGRATFALPDLQGRVPINVGQLNGGQYYVQGEEAGVESVTLLQTETPEHDHTLLGSKGSAATRSPQGAYLAEPDHYVYAGTANTTLNTGSLGLVGGNSSHSNLQPFLVLNFVIALVGIFPSRS